MTSSPPTQSIGDTMICWTAPTRTTSPTCGMVALVRWPETSQRSAMFDATSGACYSEVHSFTQAQRQHFVRSVAMGLIVNYGLDPAVVHRALWPLKEYRDGLPPDSKPPSVHLSASGATHDNR